jgi:hypothetical protein
MKRTATFSLFNYDYFLSVLSHKFIANKAQIVLEGYKVVIEKVIVLIFASYKLDYGLYTCEIDLLCRIFNNFEFESHHDDYLDEILMLPSLFRVDTGAPLL